MLARSTKVRRYEQRIEKFRKNGIFDFHQKMQTEYNGGGVRPNDVPNYEESKSFLGDIWSVGKEHNCEAEWLKDTKNELRNGKHLHESVTINVEKETEQCRKMRNWKVPGKGGV